MLGIPETSFYFIDPNCTTSYAASARFHANYYYLVNSFTQPFDEMGICMCGIKIYLTLKLHCASINDTYKYGKWEFMNNGRNHRKMSFLTVATCCSGYKSLIQI